MDHGSVKGGLRGLGENNVVKKYLILLTKQNKKPTDRLFRLHGKQNEAIYLFVSLKDLLRMIRLWLLEMPKSKTKLKKKEANKSPI